MKKPQLFTLVILPIFTMLIQNAQACQGYTYHQELLKTATQIYQTFPTPEAKADESDDWTFPDSMTHLV